MCGRIGKFGKAASDLIDAVGLDEFYARLQKAMVTGRLGFNITPTAELAFVREAPEDDVLVGRWGLEPRWAKTPESVKSLLFNARSESAAEKPSFRDAMKSSRCVVPVDGFYEWQKLEDGSKQPWWIYRADGQPMLFAGLYARHKWGDSFTILTTAPNSLMANLHDRMPVILDPADVPRWCDPSITNPELVEDLLRPCPSEWLAAHTVSKAVGNVRNDSPQLTEPVET